MTTELAKFLKKASDHCGTQNCEIREGYSGRGMYGKTTAGVVVSSVSELLLDVIQFIKEDVDDYYQTTQRYSETLPEVSDMSSLCTDNMGHDTILY